VVPTNQSDLLTRMATGEVDAAVSYPPYADAILRQGGTVLFSTAQIPQELPSLIVMDRDVLARRRTDAASVVRAWDRAVKYASTHRDESFAIMAACQRMSVSDFAHTLQHNIHVVDLADEEALLRPGGRLAETVDRTAGYLAKVKQIQARPSQDRFVSSDAVTAAGMDP
jgi:NitT/TauT family transport system substrate-binding protein